MDTNNIVATVNGFGVVEAPNDRATFTLTVKVKDDVLKSVKNQIKEKTALIIKELENKKMSLDGEISFTTFNYKLEHREGNERYPAGFQSVSHITWSVVVNDKINDIWESCLKIDPNMQTPLFTIKTRDVISAEALQKATDNVKELLNKECSLLGVSLEKLKILNWKFAYNSHLAVSANVSHPYYTNNVGVFGATGPQGSMGLPGLGIHNAMLSQPIIQKLGSIYQECLDPVILNPGTASASVSVQVSYVWAE
jgi:hypothetical protein